MRTSKQIRYGLATKMSSSSANNSASITSIKSSTGQQQGTAANSEEILTLPAPGEGVEIHSYGAGKYQFGELRLPERAPEQGAQKAAAEAQQRQRRRQQGYPVVIGIHGGYYRARYGLGYFGHVCAALTEAGCATWNIEYRRLGNRGGGWPGTFQDVAAATDYLRTLAANGYPLDLDRVIAMGHSAGGHLAAWVAGRRRIAQGSPLYCPDPLPIKAVISLAGVLDLRRAWELRLSRGVVERLLGGSPRQVPLRYDSTSPVALLPLGVPMTTLVHGTGDTSVPYELSRRYARAAVASGDAAELVTLEDTGHFEIVDPRTEAWRSVLRSVQLAIGIERWRAESN
jgi:acetyl esterase/lipase